MKNDFKIIATTFIKDDFPVMIDPERIESYHPEYIYDGTSTKPKLGISIKMYSGEFFECLETYEDFKERLSRFRFDNQ